MDQQAFKEMTRMLENFPQTNGNPDLIVSGYELAVAGLSSQAITEAAQRFISGVVDGQSVDFAPGAPRFAIEARKRQEYIDLQARPRLPPPRFVSRGPLAPFEVKRQKALTKYQDCPVLFENVSHDEARALSKAGKIPVGGAWVAGLATVYGPPAAEIAADLSKKSA